jgi:two-component sensor histidine kinase
MSFQEVTSLKEGRSNFEGRVRALAQTHNRLAETNWTCANLRDVIEDEIAPYRQDSGENMRLCGPDIQLKPKGAISLGMAFHELSTNAAKYGALSTPDGTVEITSEMNPSNRQLLLTWVEIGGPTVEPPQHTGFGRILLERGLSLELQGKVQLEFAPAGLRCVIAVPAENSWVEHEPEPGTS